MRGALPLWTALFLLLGMGGGAGAGPAAPEYEVKAAYLYNFTKFVEWPKTDVRDNLTICLYGKDPFEGFLDGAVRGRLAHDVPIVIQRLPAHNPDWSQCHVVFIGISEAPQIVALISQLRGFSVLTVGETKSFAELGGMIGLAVSGGRVRFDINLAAIAGAHLQVSSRLVELGHLVRVSQ